MRVPAPSMKRVQRDVRNRFAFLVINSDAHSLIRKIRDRVEHLAGYSAGNVGKSAQSIHTSVDGDSKVVRSVKL
jgi:hypothetical protein